VARIFSQINLFPIITTLCEFAANELVTFASANPARIAIVPPGVDDLFRAPERQQDVLELQLVGLFPQQLVSGAGRRASDNDIWDGLPAWQVGDGPYATPFRGRIRLKSAILRSAPKR